MFLFQSKDVTFRGHGDSVDQLCWHPKHPDQLVTASGDKTIRLWDARTSKSVATVNTKGKEMYVQCQSYTKFCKLHVLDSLYEPCHEKTCFLHMR